MRGLDAVDLGRERPAHDRPTSGVMSLHLYARPGERGPLRLQGGRIQRTCVCVCVRNLRLGLQALCRNLHLLAPFGEGKKSRLRATFTTSGREAASR